MSVLNPFWMCPNCVVDASRMCPRCVLSGLDMLVLDTVLAEV